MSTPTLTTYAQCAESLEIVPADALESAPAGCDVGVMCGDHMAEHIQSCRACAREVTA